jgi:predicted ester cyclase
VAGLDFADASFTTDGGSMTDRAPIDVRDVLERNITAINNRDIDAYLANQQPDVEFRLPGGVVVRGRDQVREYTESLWTAFPDGTLAFGDQVLAGDAAATEVIFAGTHTGPLLTPKGPVAPTGRRVTLRSASILRITDGLIASEHVYLDQLEMMTQLGLMAEA